MRAEVAHVATRCLHPYFCLPRGLWVHLVPRVVRTVRYEGTVLKNALTSDTNYKFVSPFRELLNLKVVTGLLTRDSSKLLHPFITGKGYRSKSARGRCAWGRGCKGSKHETPPVLRMCLAATIDVAMLMESCQPGSTSRFSSGVLLGPHYTGRSD